MDYKHVQELEAFYKLDDQEKLEKLVESIKVMEEDESITLIQEDGETYINDCSLTGMVQAMLECCLIHRNGQVNHAGRRYLQEQGYKTFAGDQDSFGWLVGCLQTKKGVICYG